MSNQNRREEFITAAQQLFYTKGYESTSVNDIINAVGVSKGAFYHYFDSKQAILAGVVDLWGEQAEEMVQAILADQTLDAVAKFNHMMQMLNNWKIEQKETMLTMAHILHMDDNLRLFHQLQRRGAKTIAPVLGKIIKQGVAEGVFDTDSPEDTAEIVVVVMRSVSNAFFEILVNADEVEKPIQAMQGKIHATQTAIERILGAPSGALHMLEMETVAAWFE